MKQAVTKEWVKNNIKDPEDMRKLTQDRLSVEEMKNVYSNIFPFEPSRYRIGKFAKLMGYCLTKQMVDRKIVYFYVKQSLMF